MKNNKKSILPQSDKWWNASYKISKLQFKHEPSYVHASKVKKLDACMRPLFANPVTIIGWLASITTSLASVFL